MNRFQIASGMCPGDAVGLTGAIRDLRATFPDAWIEVCPPYLELWRNNPHINRVSQHKAQDNAISPPVPFSRHIVEEHRRAIETQYNVTLIRGPDTGDLHGPFDYRPHPDPYWVIMAGGKFDTPAKWWPYYQDLVNALPNLTFVHMGRAQDYHPLVKGVVDVVNETRLDQFVSAIANASGVIGPVTAATHILRATGNQAPLFTIVGGREPLNIAAYSNQTVFSRLGQMKCCTPNACWENKCRFWTKGHADCMNDIRPEEVAAAIRKVLC